MGRSGVGSRSGECALATFVDPATGEPRVACGVVTEVRIYDPVAGGAALVVIDVGSTVNALAVFKDPATGELRLFVVVTEESCSSDPVAGGEALLVIEVGSRRWMHWFSSLTRRARRGSLGLLRKKVRVFDPVAGGEALLVIDDGLEGERAGILQRPGDGRASARVRVGREEGACLRPGRGRRRAARARYWLCVTALAVFKEPATGAPRLACG